MASEMLDLQAHDVARAALGDGRLSSLHFGAIYVRQMRAAAAPGG